MSKTNVAGGSLRFRRQWWNEGLHLGDQLRNVRTDDSPDPVQFDLAIFVRKDVSLRDDRTPGDLRMCLPAIVRHTSRRLADDLQGRFHRQLELAVTRIVIEAEALRESFDRLRRVQYVPQVGRIALVRPHRYSSCWRGYGVSGMDFAPRLSRSNRPVARKVAPIRPA